MDNPSDADDRAVLRVTLVFGDQAELTSPHHDHDNPLRVPAATIAADAGLPANELAGRRFTARRAGDTYTDFQLLDDPRI